jgi:hypothetical protein
LAELAQNLNYHELKQAELYMLEQPHVFFQMYQQGISATSTIQKKEEIKEVK